MFVRITPVKVHQPKRIRTFFQKRFGFFVYKKLGETGHGFCKESSTLFSKELDHSILPSTCLK